VSAAPPPDKPALPAFTPDYVNALVERAEAGDESTLPELRRLLDCPGAAKLFTNLAGRVRNAFVREIVRKNLLLREVLTREADQLRASLLGPDPTRVERLLAERVVVNWLQMGHADIDLARDGRGPNGEALQRRADHVHRRFLAALRALATVRKLARPALQVNIAEQQVNVTG
jgi:hypothetical protein